MNIDPGYDMSLDRWLEDIIKLKQPADTSYFIHHGKPNSHPIYIDINKIIGPIRKFFMTKKQRKAAIVEAINRGIDTALPTGKPE